MFKTKGYKLIDLNFGFEDLIVKTFEETFSVQIVHKSDKR